MRLSFIVTLSATFLSTQARAQIADECSFILSMAREDSVAVSDETLRSARLEHACSIGYESFSQQMSSGESLGIEVFEVFSANGAGGRSSSVSSEKYSETCELLTRTNFRTTFTESIENSVADEAFDVLTECVRTVGNELGQFVTLHPLEDGESLVRLFVSREIRDQLTVESITPVNACTNLGEVVRVPFTAGVNAIDLVCRNDSRDTMPLGIITDVRPLPVVNLPGRPLFRNMKITVEDFYSDFEPRSWVVQEVQLFDPDGEFVASNVVGTSGCFGDCTEANPSKLTDGVVASKNYWAPSSEYVDDEGAWIQLQFDASRIGSVRIVQWTDADCMSDCGRVPPKRQDNARYLRIDFDGGAESVAVRLRNEADQRFVLR